jgi:hypothetical protein
MSVTLNASTSSGLVQTADTSGTIELQSNGTTRLTVASTGAYGQLVSGTAVASTSGTSIDFTSIPSWVKRITVMFNGVSTSGTSFKQIQIGAGSVVTTGYAGSASVMSAAVGTTSFTTGFGIRSNAAADSISGISIITNISGNTWVCSTNTSNSTTETSVASGILALGGTLDRVRITTVNGTDTFDAGSINILYEG